MFVKMLCKAPNKCYAKAFTIPTHTPSLFKTKLYENYGFKTHPLNFTLEGIHPMRNGQ